MNTKSTITEADMMRALVAILVCLAILPAVYQSNSKYQVGTITALNGIERVTTRLLIALATTSQYA